MVTTMRIVALLAIAFSPLLANPTRPTSPVVQATGPALPALQATAPALTIPQTPEPLSYAHTYYVSPRGNDTNPGTSVAPLRHIQAGINKANAGDRVMALAGTYNEQLTFPRSGTAIHPITVAGQVDRAGIPLAVIDNTTPIAASWIPAPEVGSGVYKQGGLAPKLMLWNGKEIRAIHPLFMAGGLCPDLGTGFAILAFPANKTWHPVGEPITVSFWDDVHVLFGVRRDTTYIRFRDGDNPNRQALRATSSATTYAFSLRSRDYITIEHLKIQGSWVGVDLVGSDNNVIQNNVIQNGGDRVLVETGSAYNIIRNNSMTLGYIDYGSFGEWAGHFPTEVAEHNCASYALGKYLEGYSSSVDFGVTVMSAGEGNEISNNEMSEGSIAIRLCGAKNLKIHNNTITGFSSVGMLVDLGMESLYVYDNTVSHCNLCFRIHDVGANSDTTRSGWIYRNRCYNLDDQGEFSRIHQAGTNLTKPPDLWFYHNSYAGGTFFISQRVDACARMKYVNNIASSRNLSGDAGPDDDTTHDVFAAFDYNFLGGRYRGGRYFRFAGYDRHNFWSADTMRGDVEHQVWPLGSEPDWIVPDTSQAYESGLDLSDSFTIRGIEYGPLPGMTHGYFPGAKPNLGAVQDQAHIGGQQGDHGSVTQLPELAFAPNPASGRYVAVRCAIPTGEVGKLTLRDVLGRTVKNIAPVASGITQLDLQGLAPGVYVATLDAGSQSVTRKLTITVH